MRLFIAVQRAQADSFVSARSSQRGISVGKCYNIRISKNIHTLELMFVVLRL